MNQAQTLYQIPVLVHGTLGGRCMPVPEELLADRNRHSVILFCASLESAANDVAWILGETNFWKVWKPADRQGAVTYQAQVAWLIGHGLASSSALLKVNCNESKKLEWIVPWLQTAGAEYVVDTACYPSQRKNLLKTLNPTFSYYCKSEDQPTRCVGEYENPPPPQQPRTRPPMSVLHTWWDKEGIAKFSY